MHFFTLLIFLILSLNVKGQITRYTVWDFRDSLKSTGVDSLMIYSKECTGESSFEPDSCHWQEPYYLMWKGNGKFYIKKFELCHRYKILGLDSLKPYEFYFENKKIIDTEEIREFAYSQNVKKGNKMTKKKVTIEMEYDCFYKFSSSTGVDITEKKVSKFNLTSKDCNEGKNINYTKNQKTKIKRLVDLFETLVIQYNSNQINVE
jgi:hypothetical protein